jgi:hypothetical protein
MSRNTALSLVILAGIGAYFAAIWPRGTAPTAGQKGQSAPQSQVVLLTPPEAQAPGCGGRITWATRSGGEVRLRYDGEASTVWARWPGGEVKARVEDACTGVECRLVLPRPGIGDVRVGLDACQGLEMPE